jgi:hypothetical protein
MAVQHDATARLAAWRVGGVALGVAAVLATLLLRGPTPAPPEATGRKDESLCTTT